MITEARQYVGSDNLRHFWCHAIRCHFCEGSGTRKRGNCKACAGTGTLDHPETDLDLWYLSDLINGRSPAIDLPCPEENRFAEMTENLGNREVLDSLDLRCELLQISASACNGCPRRPNREREPLPRDYPVGWHKGECQGVIRSCIGDLIKNYGTPLLEIKQEFHGVWPRVLHKVMSSRQIQELNKVFDASSFRSAWNLIRGEIPQATFVVRPPVFFETDFTGSLANPHSNQVLHFLRISNRIHPGHWAICKRCGLFYLRKLLTLADNSFCSTACNQAFQNRTDRYRESSLHYFRRQKSRDEFFDA